MLDGLLVRKIGLDEYDHIRSVYDASNYRGGILDEDVGFLASLHAEPVGAVRLTNEHGMLLLRGMMVKPGYQRKGVGKALLSVLDTYIADSMCYLIAKDSLRDFYGRIGFAEIDRSESPALLVDRMKKYNEEQEESDSFIVMRRAKNHAES